MSEENAIRVIEDQPEAAAIEIPHEAERDRVEQLTHLTAPLRECKAWRSREEERYAQAVTGRGHAPPPRCSRAWASSMSGT